MKKIPLSVLIDALVVILGNLLCAVGVVLFIVPGGLIMGGSTGVGLFVNRMTGIPVSLFLLAFNVVMFAAGYLTLGKKYAATAVFSTFGYPFCLDILNRLADGRVITRDPLLCMLFGGLFIGLSIGIVIRAGASSGGMDIVPLILNKYFHLPVSVMVYVLDFLVLILQAFMCTGEEFLYGILLVLIYSIVLDKCLVIGKGSVEIKIISEKSDEIKRAILKDIDRGVTIITGRTGYLGKDTELLLSVVSSREVSRTCRWIRKIDPNAFLIISRVPEVRGKGFTEEK